MSGEMWARQRLMNWLAMFAEEVGEERRRAGKQIRELVRFHPFLADDIPQDVWEMLYHVRAKGTIAP